MNDIWLVDAAGNCDAVFDNLEDALRDLADKVRGNQIEGEIRCLSSEEYEDYAERWPQHSKAGIAE